MQEDFAEATAFFLLIGQGFFEFGVRYAEFLSEDPTKEWSSIIRFRLISRAQSGQNPWLCWAAPRGVSVDSCDVKILFLPQAWQGDRSFFVKTIQRLGVGGRSLEWDDPVHIGLDSVSGQRADRSTGRGTCLTGGVNGAMTGRDEVSVTHR